MAEIVVGSLRIRTNDSEKGPLPVGWRLEGHKHLFDHMTYIYAGKFVCSRWSGEDKPADRKLLAHAVVSAPAWFNIAAGEYHDFECLEPGNLHCIFASRDPATHDVVDHPNDFWQASGLAT